MDTTMPRPFVFVLMPFDTEFDDIYKVGIKPACDKSGAYAERVDEQIFTESILDRIYNQISKADVIVSDMTGRNPNVFYETGYAHALGKTVILLTKTADDIPFDLRHYKHIIHGGRISDLIPQLEAAISWAIKQSKHETLHESLEFYVNGQRILPNSEIKVPVNMAMHDYGELIVKIDVYNPLRNQIKEATVRMGLLVNDLVEARMQVGDVDVIKQPDKRTLIVEREGVIMTPGSWKSFTFLFDDMKTRTVTIGSSYAIGIRVFGQQGVADLPFVLSVTKE